MDDVEFDVLVIGSGASGMTTTRSRSRPRRMCASSASACVGTITRAARCTASVRSRSRTLVRRCSLRRFSAVSLCSVTTIGHGLCSIAPSIHGEWKTSAPRGRWVSTISAPVSAVSFSARSRQRQ